MLWIEKKYEPTPQQQRKLYQNTSGWYPLRNKIKYMDKHIQDSSSAAKSKINNMAKEALKSFTYQLINN